MITAERTRISERWWRWKMENRPRSPRGGIAKAIHDANFSGYFLEGKASDVETAQAQVPKFDGYDYVFMRSRAIAVKPVEKITMMVGIEYLRWVRNQIGWYDFRFIGRRVTFYSSKEGIKFMLRATRKRKKK